MCSCWVSLQDEATQSMTRYGAHSFDCARYRRSGDPVDRRQDEKLCATMERREAARGTTVPS